MRDPIFLKHYEPQFDLVFQEAKARVHMYHYLKSYHNEDGLAFLIEVDDYKQIAEHEDKLAKEKNIVEVFVKPGSQQEVNTGSSSKTVVLERVTAGERLSNNLFYPLAGVVYRELILDGFSRYIRSQELKEFLSKEGEQFTSSISLDLRKVGSRSSVLLQPKDVREKYISDKDISFIISLTQDTSDWRCVYRINSSAAYLSETNYSCGTLKDLKLGKITGVLNYNIEDCLDILISDKREFDGHQVGEVKSIFEQADDFNGNPYSIVCRNQVGSFLPFHKNRRFPMIGTTVRDTKRKAYHIVSKTTSSLEDVLPLIDNTITCDVFSGYSLYELGDEMTRYVHVYYIDVKSVTMSSKFVFKKLAIKRLGTHQNRLSELLRAAPRGRKRESTMRKCLDDFIDRYGSNKSWTTTMDVEY